LGERFNWLENLEFELEDVVGADEKASHLWHSKVEKCVKEMRGKKVTGLMVCMVGTQIYGRRYSQTNPTAGQHHL
jgi:hypothetical protein